MNFTASMVAELRFATDWPMWLVLALVACAGLASMALYLRETKSLESPWSWLLPALRATAIVLALLLLFGPVWHQRQVIGTPAKVVFAVDRSESMAEKDSQLTEASNAASLTMQSAASPDRLRRAVDLLAGNGVNEGWIEQLSETHLIEVLAFDVSPQLAWSSLNEDQTLGRPESLSSDQPVGDTLSNDAFATLQKANGLQTDLSTALAVRDNSGADTESAPDNASDQDDSESASAMVLVMMTDGRDSAGRADAADVASQLAQTGWQVHAVGMGTVEEPADVAVLRVEHPERVADDGRLAGQVWVKHFGQAGNLARVQIRSGDQLVWSKDLPLQSDGKTPVSFDFPIQALTQNSDEEDLRGVDRDTVVLSLVATVSLVNASDATAESSASGEIAGDGAVLASGSPGAGRTDNDSFSFRVAAASRDRHLLILDGSSRWETRYIRNLFLRDPAWQVDTVLFGPGTDRERVTRGTDAGELPDTQRAWGEYDAVILGEIPADQWTVEDAENLRQLVARGGGLIVIDGRYGRIAELADQGAGANVGFDSDIGDEPSKALADLIPVQFLGDSSGEGNAAELANQLARPLVASLRPTEIGRQLPAFLLDGDASRVNQVWERLPAPTTIPRVLPHGDAEVWAEAITEDSVAMPWLVTRMFGSGRVVYFATDETWRWRYKVESRLHGRFWNQILTAVMQPPYAVRDDFVAIGTDKVDYDLGQAATIRVRLIQDESSEFLSAIELPDSDTPATVDALLIKDDKIVASVPLSVEDAQRGTYVGKTSALEAGAYRIRVRASGYDAAALKASTPIWVQPARLGELDRVSIDEAALHRITEAGRGLYVHESSASEILEAIRPLSRGQIVESDTLLWQSWWVFLCVLALLATEWWLRKKVGLI